MCEMCGCAGRRAARQTRREMVQTGFPIRTPAAAVPFHRPVADANPASGKSVTNDTRTDEVAERA